MNTLGSHPGAILFRFGMLAIIIVILIGVFLSYVEEAQKTIEQASILQTKRVIDSALTVAFSTYAVKGRLNKLNDLNGSNPFEFLEEYEISSATYNGEIDNNVTAELSPGWYYVKHQKYVVYKSRYIGTTMYFAVVLNYEDLNQSGQFESRVDKFKQLQFVEVELRNS